MIVPSERRRELVDRGFAKFKIQGRNASMSVAYMDLAINILDLPGASALPKSLRPMLMVCGLLDATGKANEQRTQLPDG